MIQRILLELRPNFAENSYKCIVPRIPKATIALFLRDKNGNLEFKGIEKDENNMNHKKPFHPNFYQSIEQGDSGGPISLKVYDSNLNFESVSNLQTGEFAGEKRHVILAVISAGTGIKSRNDFESVIYPGVDLFSKCNSQASKVTEDVVDWIKKLHGSALGTGK